jgi:hypothetical protein
LIIWSFMTNLDQYLKSGQVAFEARRTAIF